MKRWLLPLSLAVVFPVLVLRGTGAPASAAAPAAVLCPNGLPHEPIVIYDVNGSTIAGPFDLQLVVYGDSFARLSTTNTPSGEGKSQITTVPRATATNLLVSLAASGALNLCDDTSFALDLPLSTLTIMRPVTDVKAHTYSWWAGQGPYGPPEQVLLDFISSAFPNF
jgi:hypothetical protein